MRGCIVALAGGLVMACGQGSVAPEAPATTAIEARAPEAPGTHVPGTETAVTETAVPPTSAVTDPPPTTEVAPVAVVPGSVRIVPLAEHALLASEVRGLESIASALRDHHLEPTVAAPDAHEREVARVWLGGTPPPAIEPHWQSAELVVLVSLLAPRTRADGQRVPRGVDGLLLGRPLTRTAYFTVALEGESAWAFDPIGPQLAGLVDAAREGAR